MTKPHLALVTPTTEIRTVARRSTPRRPTNAALRTREHLAQHEVEKLIEVVKRNRHGRRDALMIFLAYRHGLRAAEVVDLRWEQVDFRTATLHVRRVKNGTPASHPLTGREMRELRQHQRESPPSPFIFVSERGSPLSPPGFSRMVERAGVVAASRCMPTSSGTRPATSWPTTATIRGRSSPTWVTATFRTQRGIPRWAPGRFKDFWRD